LAYAVLPFLVVAFGSFFLQSYAAPKYLRLLTRNVGALGTLYNREGVLALAKTEPSERRLEKNTQAKLEETLQELQALRRLRWVGLFGDQQLRTKIEAGNQLSDVSQELLEGLIRSTQAPDSWTENDEARLKENRQALFDKARRWNELEPKDK
jgi:hypothetical protein